MFQLEDRITPDGRPLPVPLLFSGAAAGTPLVRAYRADTGELAFERQPFESTFTGGVRVAAGDLDHDGYPDLIAAAGAGGGPRVVVLSGRTGDQLSGPLGSFFAYDEAFTGGLFVASVDGDGWADLVTAAGPGADPHVKVFSGQTGGEIASFDAYDTAFRGGATIAAADLTGDGKAELIVGAGSGGGPHVVAFDLSSGTPTTVYSFYAFDESFTGGVSVGSDMLAGDVDGDGVADIVVGAGAGGGSAVKVFSGATGAEIRSFHAFGEESTVGVWVATAYVDDDAYADVITGTAGGTTGGVKVFSGADGTELPSPMSGYTPFGGDYTGGVFVAGSNDPDTVTVAYTTVSPSSIPQQTAATFYADVSDAVPYNGYQVPTGTVTFTATQSGTNTTLGTATLVQTGTGTARATLTVGPVTLPPGNYYVTASYGGSSTFLSGSGYPTSFNVSPAPPPATGDLDIIDSNGATVAEDMEESPGGWVPVNNDNDNYNFAGDQATSLVPILDRDDGEGQTGAVSRENDLIQIHLHDLNNYNRVGSFSLVWGSPNIKIWQHSDKTGPVLSGVGLPSGQISDFWVEGLTLSPAVAAEQIQLKWTDATAGAQVVDQVAFTVYEVTGAMNVPGYSQYEYWAKTPADSGFTAKFVSSNHGTVTVNSYGGPAGQPLTTKTSILWDAGAALGTYRVTPDVSVSNFFVDREVNVVKVSMSAADADDNVLIFDGPPVQSNDNPELIYSMDMRVIIPTTVIGKLKITSIEGPQVGGVNRGVRFMEMGFIQNVTFTKMRSVYNDFVHDPYVQQVVTYRSSVEGQAYLDCVTLINPSTPPWVNSNGTLAISIYPKANEVIATPDATVTNKTIAFTDTPAQRATDHANLTLTLEGYTHSATSFEILFDARMYFAVRTKEAALGSESVFTQRANALWYFNGSGTITGTKWDPIFGVTGNGLGTATNPNTTDPKAFTEVTNGAVVPLTTGTIANNATAAQTWSSYLGN